jgi:hypothetical protein
MKKRRNKKWPGLKEAAKQLNISYGHLRLCVARERDSRSLLNRFRAWKRERATPIPTKPITT